MEVTKPAKIGHVALLIVLPNWKLYWFNLRALGRNSEKRSAIRSATERIGSSMSANEALQSAAERGGARRGGAGRGGARLGGGTLRKICWSGTERSGTPRKTAGAE